MWTAVGATVMALAVIMGAFGAHALRATLEAGGMASVYEKAVFYHFIHGFGILFTARWGGSTAGWVCALLLAGIVLFSGSLYIMALTGDRWLGAITPIGGLCFIAAWLLLAFAAAR